MITGYTYDSIVKSPGKRDNFSSVTIPECIEKCVKVSAFMVNWKELSANLTSSITNYK